jgi:hypothetical protein
MKKDEGPDPHKSVGESIFDAFMDEPKEEKTETKLEDNPDITLKIDKLILKGAQKYSKLRLPYLALQLMKDEPKLFKESKHNNKQ